MWTLRDANFPAIKFNLPTDPFRWLGKNLPYADWILTVNSAYMMLSFIYASLKFGHDCNPDNRCTKTKKVLTFDDQVVSLETDVFVHFMLTLCALALGVLIWLIMELHGAVQFVRTKEIREMWELEDEISWNKHRRRLTVNNAFIEVLISLYLRQFYYLSVALLARVVVIFITTKYMASLRAEDEAAKKPKNLKGDSHPSVVVEKNPVKLVKENGKRIKIKKKVRWADQSYQ